MALEPLAPPTDQASPDPATFFARLRRSSFVRSVIGTAGTNVVATGVGALGGLLLARELGATDRGVLALIITWPTFVGLLVMAGLPQAITYFNAREPERASAAVATATVAALVISAVAGIVGWAFSSLITNRAEAVTELRLLFLLLPLYSVPIVWIASLQPKRLDLWNVARLVQPVGYFVMVVALMATDQLTVVRAVQALVVSLLLQALAGATLSWIHVGAFLRPRRELLFPLLGYGTRTVASGVPYLVNARLDQLILSVMVPAAALGNYAVAVSISLLATPIAHAFGYVAFPRIAAAKEQHEKKRLEKMAIWGSITTAAVVLLPVAVLAPWLVPKLFGEGFRSAVPVLWILVPGTVALGSNQVAEDILRGRGQPLAPAVAEAVGAALTLVLLLVLVPIYGIKGAAVTSVVVYVFVGLFLARIRRRSSAAISEAVTSTSMQPSEDSER